METEGQNETLLIKKKEEKETKERIKKRKKQTNNNIPTNREWGKKKGKTQTKKKGKTQTITIRERKGSRNYMQESERAERERKKQ